jgi:hypothetical protein
MDGLTCSTNGEKRNACSLLVGYSGALGSRPVGRPRSRHLNNIEVDVGVIEWSCVDWIGLAQDTDKWRALVNALMNILVT